jgi:demethylmenaquinone methyltransferase/2-methoxy-6-polyprenyl-1,4-benzoquinol methylase
MIYLRLINGDRDQEVTCFQKKLKVRGYKSGVARAETEHAWQTVGAEKRQAVQSLFGTIAGRYDFLNSAMSMRLHHRWRAEAVRMLRLEPGDAVADVCCGTGDFAWPIRKAVSDTAKVVGIDFSLPMLEVGKSKAVPMSLGTGDACALPLSSSAFDAVTVGWGLRNVADLEAALSEIRRVLKPGGRFVSLDMAKPRNSVVRGGSRILFSLLAPALGTIFKRRDAYKYLPQSTEKFASRDEQVALMRRVGFSEATYKDMFFGNICIHWGKV